MAKTSSDIGDLRRRLGIADPELMVVSLDDITLDTRCQARVTETKGLATTYANSMKRGDKLPPIELVCDRNKGVYYCVDGWSRYTAMRLLKMGQAECLVYHGTIDDAIRLAARANSEHGQRRSQEDTDKAVLMMAKQCPHWSISRLAKWVGCARKTVRRVFERNNIVQPEVKRIEVVRDGKVFETSLRARGQNQGRAERSRQREERMRVYDEDAGDPEPDNPPPPRIEYVQAKPEPQWAPKAVPESERTDLMGYVGPHRVAGVFTHDRKVVIDAAKKIADARNHMVELKTKNATGLTAVSQNQVDSKGHDLAAVGKWLLGQAPYAVCVYCNGRGETCRACGERGWLTRREWDVSDEPLRRQRELVIWKDKGEANDDDETKTDAATG